MNGVRYTENLQLAEQLVAGVETPDDVDGVRKIIKGLKLKGIDYDNLSSLLDDLEQDMKV